MLGIGYPYPGLDVSASTGSIWALVTIVAVVAVFFAAYAWFLTRSERRHERVEAPPTKTELRKAA
jgi:hypothetical protein